MKYINKILCMLVLTVAIGACDRELESEGIAVGLIRYPSITLNEGSSVSMVADEGSYVESGAVALLGTEDISNQIQINGAVDTSVPGVYPIKYSVSVENEIGQQSTATQTRFVIVTSEDISDVDLSGSYFGSGGVSKPIAVTVTKLGNGWYAIPDVLSSSNGIAASFAHIGGDEIVIPSQVTGFGEVNTTSAGTSATITPNGFRWSVLISCCGVRGPVEFVKQ